MAFWPVSTTLQTHHQKIETLVLRVVLGAHGRLQDCGNGRLNAEHEREKKSNIDDSSKCLRIDASSAQHNNAQLSRSAQIRKMQHQQTQKNTHLKTKNENDVKHTGRHIANVVRSFLIIYLPPKECQTFSNVAPDYAPDFLFGLLFQ